MHRESDLTQKPRGGLEVGSSAGRGLYGREKETAVYGGK